MVNATRDVRAELNTNEGTAKVFVRWTVVDTVENPAAELTVEEAKKKKGAQIDDVIEEGHEVTSFGV